MIRELTEAQRAAMNEAMRPFWVEMDGLRPAEVKAFEAGFIAGLTTADADLLAALRAAKWELQGHIEKGTAMPIIDAALARVEGGE